MTHIKSDKEAPSDFECLFEIHKVKHYDVQQSVMCEEEKRKIFLNQTQPTE